MPTGIELGTYFRRFARGAALVTVVACGARGDDPMRASSVGAFTAEGSGEEECVEDVDAEEPTSEGTLSNDGNVSDELFAGEEPLITDEAPPAEDAPVDPASRDAASAKLDLSAPAAATAEPAEADAEASTAEPAISDTVKVLSRSRVRIKCQKTKPAPAVCTAAYSAPAPGVPCSNFKTERRCTASLPVLQGSFTCDGAGCKARTAQADCGRARLCSWDRQRGCVDHPNRAANIESVCKERATLDRAANACKGYVR